MSAPVRITFSCRDEKGNRLPELDGTVEFNFPYHGRDVEDGKVSRLLEATIFPSGIEQRVPFTLTVPVEEEPEGGIYEFDQDLIISRVSIEQKLAEEERRIAEAREVHGPAEGVRKLSEIADTYETLIRERRRILREGGVVALVADRGDAVALAEDG